MQAEWFASSHSKPSFSERILTDDICQEYEKPKNNKKSTYAKVPKPAQNYQQKKTKMKLALAIELCEFIKYDYGCWVGL